MGISETMQDSIERPDRVVRMGDIRHDRVLLRKLESSLMAAERKSVYVCGNHDMDSLAAAHDKAIDLEESRNVLLNNSARMINSAMEFLCSFGGWLSLVDEEEVGSVLRTSNPIFEGAQGVMLDEHFGHYPHVTWSDTTDRNAVSLLHEAGIMDYHCVGVTRKYGTRHGPGPLFDDDPQFPAKDVHNVTGKWQGRMRYGNLNYAELRRAIQCCKRVDSVAVTHADASGPTPNSVAENLSRPLKLISHGPKTCDTMFPANVEV
jgi:adenylosuccinate synthase